MIDALIQSFPSEALFTLAHGGSHAAGGQGGGGGGGGFPLIHPILVNFTAALVPTSFAADLLGAWLKKDGLRATGWWTMLLAGIVTPFTAMFGWVWFLTGMSGQGTPIVIHQWLGTSIAVVVVGLAIWRGMRFYRSENKPGWAYGIIAAILFCALLVQGDFGASMSFGRGIVISGPSHQHAAEPAHDEHDHDHVSHAPAEPR